MEKLKDLIEKYNRWKPYHEYILRIESQKDIDLSICIENTKSLLEGIGKEICFQKSQTLDGSESVSKVLSLSFGCLGYPPVDTIRQIGTSIANIGQQIGNFRNEIGSTSHGKTIEELKSRNQNLDNFTTDFLIHSAELVCCFLIEAFEKVNPLPQEKLLLNYEENEDFNEYWDDLFENYIMSRDYVFAASEILFNCDFEAYRAELNSFRQTINETNN